MTLDFWFGFATFPLVAAFAALIFAAVATASATNHGAGGCQVCDQAFGCEPGEYTRLGIWLRTRRHSWFISRRPEHREAWANNRWNPFRNEGVPTDGGIAADRRPRPGAVRRLWYFLRY